MICNYWKFQLTNKRAPVKQLSWCLWAALTFILNSRPSFIWICILPEPSLFCLKSMVPFGPVDCRSTSSYSYESAAASCWRSCKKEEGEAKQTCKRCLKNVRYNAWRRRLILTDSAVSSGAKRDSILITILWQSALFNKCVDSETKAAQMSPEQCSHNIVVKPTLYLVFSVLFR